MAEPNATPTGARFDKLATSAGYVLPVSCGTLVWRYQEAFGLTIVVKASFGLDETPMAPRPAEPLYNLDAVTMGGSLVAPVDMVPRRNRVDITASGTAQSASKSNPEKATVRFAVMQGGKVQFGRSQRVVAGSASPFSPQPILFGEHADPVPGVPLIDGDGVLHIPKELPWSHFQAAPKPQQIETLRGDAVFLVEGLHPQHPSIHTALPGVWCVATIFGMNEADPNQGSELVMRPDTVAVNAERLLCSVVWRAEIGLPAPEVAARLRIAAGVATHEHPLTAPTQPELDRVEPLGLPFRQAEQGHAPPPLVVSETTDSAQRGATVMATGDDDGGPALPFAALAKRKKESGGAAAWAALISGESKREERQLDTTSEFKVARTASSEEHLVKSHPTLPFTKPAAKVDMPSAAAWAAAFAASEKGGTAAIPSGTELSEPLPFGGDAPPDGPRDETPPPGPTAEELEAKAAEERLADQRANEAEAAREAAKAEAEKQAAEEKARFAEEQRLLAEKDARREAEAAQRRREKAEKIKGDMYGDFED